MNIGCIGQGFVGKNISDELEERGYSVVRYALEEPYVQNRDTIKDCEIVFVGVPTPTTPEGFDASIITEAVSHAGETATVVIKSTILPGTAAALQKAYPKKTILFSPEFLCEKTALEDVRNPILNIIGIDKTSTTHTKQAEQVMSILPKCENNHIVSWESAETFKYAHNLNGYFRVILTNLLFEVNDHVNGDWSEVKLMMDQDPMMSPFYNTAVHQGGRGAGGNCFVKDMAAFRHLYESILPDDTNAIKVLKALETKNIELLKLSNKSNAIVKAVYGE